MAKRNVKTAGAALSRTNKPVSVSVIDSAGSQRVAGDGLENVVAGLGTHRDKMHHTHYAAIRPMTRFELENMYRTSWLAKRIVNGPAEDMTREWRTTMFEGKKEENELAVENAEKALGLKAKVTEALMWSRLFGGALLIIGTKDKDLSKPLLPEQVKEGDLQWLQVVDRWRISPSGIRTTDLTSPNFGLPESYVMAESAIEIHWTRVIRFNGQKLPYFAWMQNAMWDDSELQHVVDSLRSCDVTTRGIASMVFEANVDVITVPELNELASSKDGEAKITKRFQLAAMMKSFNRTLLLSDGETYEKKANSFANMDKVALTFMIDVCGAADMPMTRLFGQSAAGLNAPGDGELRNYYDRISAEQEADLRPKLEQLDEILIRSTLGTMPDDYSFEFNSLWQMSDKETADTQYANAQRDQIYINTGVLTEGAVARELKENGTYKTLTDDDVEMAEELSEQDDTQGGDPGGIKPGTPAIDPATGQPIKTGEAPIKEGAGNAA